MESGYKKPPSKRVYYPLVSRVTRSNRVLSKSMDTRMPPSIPHVAILMGTYNGEAYLSEQLDSIEGQQHAHWTLHVSDDSPLPGTRRLLEAYQRRWGEQRLKIYPGKQQGFAANFMSLVRNSAIQGDYYAFADQDDRWHPEKLTRAVERLAAYPPSQPQLYTARAQLVDEQGTPTGYSTLQARAPGFNNALVQNIASGNTMVFNQAARECLQRSPHGEDTGLHDWWCYLLISGCGGRVVYDSTPCIDYRQHASNLIGMQRGIKSLLTRIKHLWQGGHRMQIDRNLTALADHRDWLEPQHQASFDHYRCSRHGNPWQRLQGLIKARVYRQTWQGNLAMRVAALLNKG
ncbi:MAG: glycosyl transferase family 2 [Halomonas sp.]|nr:glycosyl transferase family 2 [Halomonas sp.]|tara:strand:+ start:2809 stop:3846 length:1038 start_codon:yes stop_codon:yes gene_type:complete